MARYELKGKVGVLKVFKRKTIKGLFIVGLMMKEENPLIDTDRWSLRLSGRGRFGISSDHCGVGKWEDGKDFFPRTIQNICFFPGNGKLTKKSTMPANDNEKRKKKHVFFLLSHITIHKCFFIYEQSL